MNSASAPLDEEPRGFLSLVLLGALLGAAWGVGELALAFDATDAAVARRGARLLLFAVLETGVLGALLALGFGVLQRLLALARFPPARGRGRPLLLGALAGLALFVQRMDSGAIAHAQAPHADRLGWLALQLGLALAVNLAGALVAELVAARLRERRTGRILGRLAPLVPLAALAVLAWGIVRIASGASAAPPASQAGAEGPDIVLVVIDTLRADVLGAHGGEAATPVLDGLASEGVLFEEALAPSSWTLPSVVSLFSSQPPSEHGFVEFHGRMEPDVLLLPEVLRSAGYSCRGVVANDLMTPPRGFDRGFDVYDLYGFDLEGELVVSRLFDALLLLAGPQRSFGISKRPFLHPSSEPPFLWTRLTHYLYDQDVNARVEAHALAEAEGPVFLYVHYFGPHSPYLEHPVPFLPGQPEFEPENTGLLWERYVGEVEHTDRMLGELLEALPPRFDDAVVLVTSDHGEEFREHGRWLHGKTLYQEVVHVPLILRAMGLAGGERVAAPVGLVDVAPTLLGLAGIEPPASFRGRDLLALLPGAEPAREPEPVVTELLSKSPAYAEDVYAVRAGVWKVQRTVPRGGGAGELQAWNLAEDPSESTPLPVGEEHAALVRLLEANERSYPADAGRTLDEDELERLKAIGYISE